MTIDSSEVDMSEKTPHQIKAEDHESRLEQILAIVNGRLRLPLGSAPTRKVDVPAAGFTDVPGRMSSICKVRRLLQLARKLYAVPNDELLPVLLADLRTAATYIRQPWSQIWRLARENEKTELAATEVEVGENVHAIYQLDPVEGQFRHRVVAIFPFCSQDCLEQVPLFDVRQPRIEAFSRPTTLSADCSAPWRPGMRCHNCGRAMVLAENLARRSMLSVGFAPAADVKVGDLVGERHVVAATETRRFSSEHPNESNTSKTMSSTVSIDMQNSNPQVIRSVVPVGAFVGRPAGLGTTKCEFLNQNAAKELGQLWSTMPTVFADTATAQLAIQRFRDGTFAELSETDPLPVAD